MYMHERKTEGTFTFENGATMRLKDSFGSFAVSWPIMAIVPASRIEKIIDKR